jgi:hypothetical protein
MPYSHVAASAARCRRDHCLLWTRLVTAAARRRLGEPAVPAKRGCNGWLLASRIGTNARYTTVQVRDGGSPTSAVHGLPQARVCASRRQSVHLRLEHAASRVPGATGARPHGCQHAVGDVCVSLYSLSLCVECPRVFIHPFTRPLCVSLKRRARRSAAAFRLRSAMTDVWRESVEPVRL